MDKELENIVQQRDILKLDIDQIAKKGEKLNQLQAKRDEILGKLALRDRVHFKIIHATASLFCLLTDSVFLCATQSIDFLFEGQYGSEQEQQMEKEMDWLLEQKHHVDQAHFRWKQAQLMCREACSQLAEAVQKWKDLLSIAPE